MGCGSRRLPPNGTIVPLTVTTQAKVTPPKPKARKLIDHHCDVCGYSGPQPQHVCKPKPIPWISTRQATCKRCDYAVDGVCTLYKSQHPDRDAVISVGVEMPYAACPAGLWPRVELTCPECESVTFHEKGVTKCKSCGYRPPRRVSLPNVVRLKPEQPFEPVNPFAIITLAVGQKATEQHAITGPQMAAYAERCGADYHAITDDQSPSYPLANKFRLKTLAAKYDRVLYLDADVWVRSSAPNIFDACDADHVWMHADRTFQKDPNYLVSNYAEIARQQQVQAIVDYGCFNSGVVLFSKQHIDLWTAPPLPAPTQFLTEQIWIEYNARRTPIPLANLPTEWNTQWWFADFAKLEADAHFVHLAACPPEERIYRLRKLAHKERYS